jgi:hypothetical protein
MATSAAPIQTVHLPSLDPKSSDSEEVALERFAAIAGRWKFNHEPATAQFDGPDDPAQGWPLGLARAAGRFRDGVIRTGVTLNQLEKTGGGIFFGFETNDSPYCVVQLGACERAYAITEYRPGRGWIAIAQAGLLANLSTEHVYEMQVTVRGQSMQLNVDGVDVLQAVASRPLEGSGFGLFAWGDAQVLFRCSRFRAVESTVFVIMPFSEPFDTLYRDVIYPVASKLDFRVIRVDEIAGPGIILEDIQRQVENSQAVIAEISTHNPNVFYELGYAHALRKPAILLVRRQEGQRMPFDVQGYRAIFYDDSMGGKKTVERSLEQHLRAILGA